MLTFTQIWLGHPCLGILSPDCIGASQYCPHGLPACAHISVDHVQVRSEKKMKAVANFLSLQVEELPPLESAPDLPRVFETWIPSKIIKNYNWRCDHIPPLHSLKAHPVPAQPMPYVIHRSARAMLLAITSVSHASLRMWMHTALLRSGASWLMAAALSGHKMLLTARSTASRESEVGDMVC